MQTTTAPTAAKIAMLAREIDALKAWNPTAGEVFRQQANLDYRDRTLDCDGLYREIRDFTTPRIYSDAYLTHQAAQTLSHGQPTGFARAARYLLDVPEHARAAVVSDAHLCTNMSGGRYADNVWSSAQRWESALAAQEDGTHRRLATGTYSEPNLPGTGG